MTYTVQRPGRMQARVLLPSSKSLSNRALLLSALCSPQADILRTSDCDDTRVMLQALENRSEVVDILAAGTAMRFLTAYFASTPGEDHVLTGTQRMRERPISVLVDALRTLGADIEYVENEGFPPLRISGRKLDGGELTLKANVSSQYVSALLMVAPTMDKGLVLHLDGDIISRPYIDMTLYLMRDFGAEAEWTTDQSIQVRPGGYSRSEAFTVESDWSAASYWYEMVALSPDAEARVELPHLYAQSLQGDSAVHTYFLPLGVKTEFVLEPDGISTVVLTKDEAHKMLAGRVLELDLVDQPDLAQTLVVTCAMLHRPFRFTGLKSLRIKETDRVAALQAELLKFGISLEATDDGELHIFHYPDHAPAWDGRAVCTYHDHRMAMSFAPAALVTGAFEVEHPEVVSKSYPHFWEDLKCLY